jgi:hypothetical protein
MVDVLGGIFNRRVYSHPAVVFTVININVPVATNPEQVTIAWRLL